MVLDRWAIGAPGVSGSGSVAMPDNPAATVEQLQAELRELRQFRDLFAMAQADKASLQKQVVGLASERAEAVEQRAAMAAILHLIASASADLSRVFDVVAEQAYRLCEASSS